MKRTINLNLIILAVTLQFSNQIIARTGTTSCSTALTRTVLKSIPDGSLFETIKSLSDSALLKPEHLERFGSRQLAEAIIFRLHVVHESTTRETDTEPIDLLRDSEIHLRFKANSLEGIKANGFLNQHDVHASSGHYDPELRLRADNQLAGLEIPTDKSFNKLRPKYGYLNLERGTSRLGGTKKTDWYGEIVAVMKDSVKKRTTWTYEDSLRNFGRMITKESQSTLIGLRNTMYYGHFNPILKSEYRTNYIEAQIFGELDLSDVDYFLVDIEKLNSPTLEKLKDIGLPIYSISYLTNTFGFVIEQKGKQIF